jgi:methionine synthase II (cobalamin-independent)
VSGFPWPGGAATGVGSLPGSSSIKAARLVAGELPDLPHVPELPARGPEAAFVGRTAGLLVDLHVDLQPSGWRLVPRPGRDERRAQGLLAQDLDAVEEALDGYVGPVKAQVAGPWTMAAMLELERGERAVSDAGAVRDLIASLTEGVAGHLAELARRVPGATLVAQLDEPALPAVLAGRLPTASGYGTLRAVESAVVENGLRTVLSGAAAYAPATVVHCCASTPSTPLLPLLRRAGATAVSLDATLLDPASGPASGPASDEALGELVEAGGALFLGIVPSTDTKLSVPGDTVGTVRKLWRRLGFDPGRLPEAVVVTPTCGLAGATPGYALAALERCRAAARSLIEDPEG